MRGKTNNKVLALSLVSVLALSACGGRSGGPAPVTQYGAQAINAAGTVSVLPGDTLWTISKRYDLPMRDFIDLNKLAPPFELAVGQRLKMPTPRKYNVQAGDTLYGISRVYGVSVTDLVRANNLQAPYKILVNDELTLPVSYQRSGMTAREPRPVPKAKVLYEASPKPRSKPVVAPSSSHNGQFSWPVKGQVISSFGPKTGGLHNDGVNILVPRGTSVKSAASGTVVYVGDELESFGNLVLVRHGSGWMTAYAHLDNVSVSRGQEVSLGQKLGGVGTTGGVDTPQLHFEIRKGAEALNPQIYLPKI